MGDRSGGIEVWMSGELLSLIIGGCWLGGSIASRLLGEVLLTSKLL